jgi:hypothetical protein
MMRLLNRLRQKRRQYLQYQVKKILLDFQQYHRRCRL